MLAAWAVIVGSQSLADTISWNLVTGGDWDTTTTNWTPDGGGRNDGLFANGDTVIFSNNAGGTINITAPRAPASTQVTAAAGTYTFSGSDLTSGGLSKSGAGTLVLNSAIASGGLNFAGNGTVRLGAAERLPNGSVITSYAVGGTLDMNNFFETVGGLQFAWDLTNFAGMTIAVSGDRNGGNITGTGTLTFAGAGTHYFGRSGALSSYTATVINSGDIRLYVSADVFATNGSLTVNSPGTLVLDHYNSGVQQTVGALSGNGNIFTSSTNASGTPFRIGNDGGSATFSGVYSGNGALIKLGGGIQTLNGNNTYTGPTTINGGTLRVNGTTGLGQQFYTVNNTGTLGGSGTINLLAGNAVTVANGGTLAPGNSAGTLTINGDLILNSGSFLDFELGSAVNPATSDHVVLGGSGNLTLDGTLNITRLPGFIGGNFTLFTYAGALVDNGLIVLDGEFLVNTDTPGIVFLQFVPVPEPSTFALLGLGVVGLAIKRRWRSGKLAPGA